MGGYLAYTEYKESGIEWLGKVPSHWTCGIKLVYLSEEKRHSFVNGPFGSDLLTSELTDEGIPVIYSGDVKSGKFSRKSDKYVSPDKAMQLNFCRVDPGDLLLAKVGDPPGDAAMYPVDETSGIVTQDVVRIKVDQEKASPSYLCHFMNSKVGNYIVRLISVEATRGRFSLGDFKSIKFSVPPLEEQRAIARFLDYKTTQIDTLIAKKETLLKKLAEKRTALISQAVTKGCDRAVPMKDSGIEWLGEIPAHWDILPLRRLLSEDTQNGLYKSKEYFKEDGIPFIQMGEAFAEPVISKVANDRVLVSDLELKKWCLIKGDLIFARRSLVFEGSGKCSVVGNLPEPHIYESSMIRVRLDTKRLNSMFAFFYFGSSFSRAQMLATTKRVTISGIDSQQLKAMIFTLPPVHEQTKILKFIEIEDSVYRQNYQRIEKAINYLKEYRTALITNAVTGKIDVRDVVLELEPVEAA
jgi:type I restriction enzyme, S subunit